MKKYLLDSNILSEPSKPVPDKRVMELIAKNRKDSAVSVLSYFEMLRAFLFCLKADGRNGLLHI